MGNICVISGKWRDNGVETSTEESQILPTLKVYLRDNHTLFKSVTVQKKTQNG